MQKLEHHADLDSRGREVLREIVIQYVSTGEPISSRSLAKCGRFGLSSASLRNVMADLEDFGFLAQPHTSAGRVPTDRGYRFFIENLMTSRALTRRERETIEEVAESKIMCIIVGVNGVVVNKIIAARQPFSREELEKIGRYISVEFSGMTLDAIRSRLVQMTEQERAVHDQMLQKTIALGIEAVNDVAPVEHELYVEGASSMLMKPDFVDAASLRKTMLALQEKEKLIEILESCLDEEGLQILIGSETDFTQVHNFSLVARRYGSSQAPLGMVGIIGPMRMEYARIAPLVDYLSRVLSRKIEEGELQQ